MRAFTVEQARVKVFLQGGGTREQTAGASPYFHAFCCPKLPKTVTLKGIGTGIWQTCLLTSSGILGGSYTIILKLTAISDDKKSEKRGWRHDFVPLFRSHDEEPYAFKFE